jgi:hypothetical protein
MAGDKVIFRVHAVQRMFQRQLDETDVRDVLERGEVIEDYPNDTPYPSRLLLGWAGARPVHVVVAHNSEDHESIVITVYVPDPKLWEPGFRRRRT